MQIFSPRKDPNGNNNFHQLQANTANGTPYDFTSLTGKVVLVVNGASESRFCSQLSGLQKLYDKYRDQGFEILLFPSNQFGDEPSRGAKLSADHAQQNYKVTFPVMEKVDVNGSLVHPVYEFLKSQQTQLGLTRIKWNFEKFLVDKKGQCVDRFAFLTEPEDIAPAVALLLGKN